MKVILAKYEYDLYQDRDAHDLVPELTTRVASYINRAQGTVFIHDHGPVETIWRGPQPQNPRNFEIPNDQLKSDNFWIALVSYTLTGKFHMITRKFAVVSSTFCPRNGSIPIVLYMAYLTVVAILDAHIMGLQEHPAEKACPLDHKPKSGQLLKMMQRGALCEICQENLKTAVELDEVDSDLVTAMNRIFEYIAADLDGPKKESFTRVSETEQQSSGSASQVVTPEPATVTASATGTMQEDIDSENIEDPKEHSEGGKYEVDLYHEGLFFEQSRSLSRYIAEFVNELDTNIIVHDGGEGSANFEGKPPFDITNLKTVTPSLGDKLTAFLLTNSELKEPFLHNDRFSIVSVISHLQLHGVHPHLGYTYLFAIALLGQRQKMELGTDFKGFPPSDELTLDQLIKDRYLPENQIKSLEVLALRDPSIKAFTYSIRTIVQAVADKYHDENPPDAVLVPDDVTPAVSGNRPAAAITEQARPIDALNYRVYANAFGDLITHPDTGTPLTIGICAPWGRGKTVLLNYIQDRIKDKSDGKTNCVCIEFNAWQYTKAEQLWAAFYSTILDAVEDSLKMRQWIGFKLNFFWKAHAKWLLPLLVIIAGVAAAFAFSVEYVQYWGLAATLLSVIITLWKAMRSVSKNVLAPSGWQMLKETASIKREIFRRIDIVRQWLVKKQRPRMVVFIDDIDRCSPDKIMQMLESIKLLLDTKNFVFVLAMDARVVRLAVGQHYKFMAQKPVEREEMGRYYLEKIIQIPFAVPPANPTELVQMKNQLFEELLRVPEVEGKESTAQPETTEPKATPADTGPPRSVPPAEGEPVESDRVPVPDATVSEPIGPGRRTQSGREIDSTLDMSITPDESTTLGQLLSENLDLSPRLLTRVKNVYLIAKHLHQTERKNLPPPALMQWIALSVKFPFESRAVAETCEMHNWKKDWSEVFDELRFEIGKPVRSYKIDRVNLKRLQDLLTGHIGHPDVVREFIKYANCFNLVLD